MRRRILPVALLAMVVAASLPLEAQPTGPQLEIVAIQVLDGPRWVHSEALDGKVQVAVRNDGNAPAPGYRLDYHWVQEERVTWLNGEEATSFDVSDAPLSPGERREHAPIGWRLRSEHQGPGAVRVTLSMGAQETADRETLSWFVPVHDLRLAVPGGDRQIHADGTAFAALRVTNHGNVDETATLTHDGRATPPERLHDLTPSLQRSTLSVGPGQSAAAVLFVDYSFSGQASPFTAWYDIRAETAYGRSLHAATPAFHGNHSAMPPGSTPAIARLDDLPLTVSPGGAVARDHRITNAGHTSDTYRIRPLPSTGWDAAVSLPGLPAGDTQRVALDAGASALFRLTVSPPHGALEGTPGQVVVEVASDRPMEAETAILPYRVQGPAVRLEAGSWATSAYVGDMAEAVIEIHNDGDAPTPDDGAITITATGAQPFQATVAAPAVEPGAMKVLAIPAGPLSEGGELSFRAEWESQTRPIHAAGTSHDMFVHAPGLDIRSPRPLAGVPGERVGYHTGDHVFFVRNDGNAEETLRVTVQSDGAASSLAAQDVFVLAPGQGRSVPIDVQIPRPSGAALEVATVLSVAIEGRPGLAWLAHVSTAVEDVTAPAIEAQPQPTLWSLAEPLALAIHVTDDAAVDSASVVQTSPDGQESVHILYPQGEDAWGRPLVLVAPGNHSFRFQARDVHGNEATTSAHTVRAQAIPAPRLRLSGAQDGAVVPADAAFTLHVDDTLPTTVAVEVLGSGGHVHRSEPDVDQGAASFQLPNLPGGAYTIVVEATNSAGAWSRVVRNVTIESPGADALEETLTGKDATVGLWTMPAAVAIAGLCRRAARRGGGA